MFYIAASVFTVGGILVGIGEFPWLQPSTSEQTSWSERFSEPVLGLFSRHSSLLPWSVAVAAPCTVSPLPAIEDPAALAFENASGGASRAVDTGNLTPATARALARFEKVVTSKGGELKITSAFRPASYQLHLQQVWDKWMHELRYNVEPGCETLKAQVGREFARHSLLERQRPVPISDHTLGIGFDAAVTLPPAPRKHHRLASLLDKLASLCRLRRPDVLHDPVHFRFTGVSRKSQIAKVVAVSYRRNKSS